MNASGEADIGAIIMAYEHFATACGTDHSRDPPVPTRKPTVRERYHFLESAAPEFHTVDHVSKATLMNKIFSACRALDYHATEAELLTHTYLCTIAPLIGMPLTATINELSIGELLDAFNLHVGYAQEHSTWRFNVRVDKQRLVDGLMPTQHIKAAQHRPLDLLYEMSGGNDEYFHDDKHARVATALPLGRTNPSLEAALPVVKARYLSWLDNPSSAPAALQPYAWIHWYAAYNILNTIPAALNHPLPNEMQEPSAFLSHPVGRQWWVNFSRQLAAKAQTS